MSFTAPMTPRVPRDVTPESIAARIERLPLSPWHLKVRLLIGAATFFDAFDTMAIAFVMPVLFGLWHLTPGLVGLLFSAGYAGQFIGASFFGWVGERHGRVFALNCTIVILSVFGLACAFAWSFQSLLVLRFIQGLGLGGEIPIASTYVNEIAKTARRGRFVLWVQCVYPFGIMMASIASVWVVPHLGWQWMFVIGAVPGFLILPLRWLVPESPRWLARRGRVEEADRVLAGIERIVSRNGAVMLPPIPDDYPDERSERATWRSLFQGIYARRTLSIWVLWFAAAALGQILQAWLPTILRSVYKLPLDQVLRYNAVGYVMLLAICVATALLIDRVGRRPLFLLGYGGACVLLGWLWLVADGASAITVAALAMTAANLASIMLLSFNVYAPEIYPTRMRSLGTGTASAWARLASIVMPSVIGFIMSRDQFSVIFLMSAVIALIGTAVVFFFVVETKGRPLEEISP